MELAPSSLMRGRSGIWRGRTLGLLLALLVTAVVLAISPGSTPVRAAPALSIEARCTPEAIRPDEEALLTCEITLENSGDEGANGIGLRFDFAPGLSSPLEASISAFDQTANGQPMPFDYIPLNASVGDLAAGEVVEIRARVIFSSAREDAYGAKVELRQEDRVVDSAVINWDVVAGAVDPPTSLAISKTLLTEADQPSPSSPPSATEPAPDTETAVYELVVSNQSDETITDITVLDSYPPELALVSAEPPAITTDAETRIARWDVGSLAPGEETRIRATFAPVHGCAYHPSNAMVVTAQAGRAAGSYATRSSDSIVIGTDCTLGLPGTGSGGEHESGSWFESALALLVAGGLALVGTARMRRARLVQGSG